MAEPKTYLNPPPTKGYARNSDLEAAVQARPDDSSAYLVYADWLSQQGDPRGELIVLQHKRSTAHAEADALATREAEILQEHESFFGGIVVGAAPKHLRDVGDGVVNVTWKWGFFESARVFNTIDWMDGKFPSREVCQRFFNLPAAAVLKELKVGVLRWEYQGDDVKALVEEASRAPFAKGLKVFRLGDVEGIDVDCGHHTLGDLSGVPQAFPNLTEFTLFGSEFNLGSDIDLPSLQTLKVKTCGLSKQNLKAILEAKLPNLEHLDLWFGSEDYGCDASLDDLAPIFDGTAFPKLKHLGIMNTEMVDDVCERIGRSKIIAQLTSLDLSLGTMSDAGARALLADRNGLKHLTEINVSENFLSDEVLEELEAIGPKIVSDDQKDIEEDYRYVSIAE